MFLDKQVAFRFHVSESESPPTLTPLSHGVDIVSPKCTRNSFSEEKAEACSNRIHNDSLSTWERTTGKHKVIDGCIVWYYRYRFFGGVYIYIQYIFNISYSARVARHTTRKTGTFSFSQAAASHHVPHTTHAYDMYDLSLAHHPVSPIG